jgi:hypothetical protein
VEVIPFYAHELKANLDNDALAAKSYVRPLSKASEETRERMSQAAERRGAIAGGEGAFVVKGRRVAARRYARR